MGDITPAVREAPARPTALEDAWLVARLAEGDEPALTALYRRYGRYVYSLAAAITRDAGAGEEVTQDVFASIWRNAKSYRPEQASVGTWIMRIARNRAIDELRRSRTRTRALASDTAASDLLAIADGRADVEVEVMNDELRGDVRAALEALPREQRQAITLAFFQGYTHAEIAARLHEPVGTVKTRIRLGMRKLRDSLGGTGQESFSSDGRYA